MGDRRLRQRWDRLREAVQSRVWPLPTAAIVGGVILGVALPELDRVLDPIIPEWLGALLFAGAPDSARAMLSAISGSLITVTSLTFSLTVVALQLASSQASPRLLRMFASDRRVHATLAMFLGTFAFAMTVLRSVRSADESVIDDTGFVPRIAVSLTFILMLVAVVALTLFLAHLATRLRVETMLRDVHGETTRSIRSLFSEEPPGDDAHELPIEPRGRRLALATRSGFLVGVDRTALRGLAVRENLVISVDTAVGEDLIEGVPIASWWPRDILEGPRPDDTEATERINAAIARAHLVEYERTSVQDVGFGLRQLVDVAVKALSPGVNDPTTAVHALGHVSSVLGDLVSRPIPSTVERDDDGVIRVVGRQLDLDALLDVAITGPRQYGAGDLEVALRLLRLLREVAWRSIHPELVNGIRRRATEVLAAAETPDRTRDELARLAAARTAVLEALEQRWPVPGAGTAS
ncbi:DUF2254 domain-containing protein [uncultured Schumannella sp.]|uniref:DUF2254 domain-containing protein n=1 Tax=uncultured Schumannella sp. TaxID=1195956 RepID=UPI0025E6575D|nr:DUF2254 domain-containing protein [uncultured Schumannella sp.]